MLFYSILESRISQKYLLHVHVCFARPAAWVEHRAILMRLTYGQIQKKTFFMQNNGEIGNGVDFELWLRQYCEISSKEAVHAWYVVHTMVGIGYPKFGYPRVIPGPEPNFGYGLGWVCVWIPWVFSGWVPIKFKILGFFGYYPRVPVRIGYPKFGHPRVIPKQYYDEKCSYIQRYKYY